MEYLKVLSKEERATLYEAPSLISYLIGGADDNLDRKERETAVKIANYRKFTSDAALHFYYEQVGEVFQSKLDALIDELPGTAAERTPILTERLAALNPLLAKLDPEYSEILYKSLKSFAAHVAKASGGVLRFLSESAEEKQLVNLDMLQDPLA